MLASKGARFLSEAAGKGATGAITVKSYVLSPFFTPDYMKVKTSSLDIVIGRGARDAGRAAGRVNPALPAQQEAHHKRRLETCSPFMPPVTQPAQMQTS